MLKPVKHWKMNASLTFARQSIVSFLRHIFSTSEISRCIISGSSEPHLNFSIGFFNIHSFASAVFNNCFRFLICLIAASLIGKICLERGSYRIFEQSNIQYLISQYRLSLISLSGILQSSSQWRSIVLAFPLTSKPFQLPFKYLNMNRLIPIMKEPCSESAI